MTPWPFSVVPGAVRTIPLWDTKWDSKSLAKRRGKIGTISYNRGFRQMALSDESRTFPFFGRCLRYGVDPRTVAAPDWPLYGGADPASEGRPGSALFVLARSPDGKRLPIAMEYGAWSPDVLADKVLEMDSRLRVEAWYFENNALQSAFISLVNLKAKNRPEVRKPIIYGFQTGRNKADENTGLPSLNLEFENEDWLICAPDHGGQCQLGPVVKGIQLPCAWCQWISDMLAHPLVEGFDLGMACWFAREAARTLVVGKKMSELAQSEGGSRWHTEGEKIETNRKVTDTGVGTRGRSRWRR